jgi:hypothetical protein
MTRKSRDFVFRWNSPASLASRLFIDNKRSNCKLRTYRLFKNKFTFEPYLYWGNYDKRRLITKFRISSHQLEIERERYRNIPTSPRICKLCNLEVDDELHFPLECPKSNKIRKEILEQLENKFNNIKSLDNTSKFVWLFSAEDNYAYDKL